MAKKVEEAALSFHDSLLLAVRAREEGGRRDDMTL